MSSKSVIRSMVVVFILCVSLPSWAAWTHIAGGAKWSFTYTGENNKFAVVNGIVETYSSSLSVPSIVQHDNSTNTNKWPVFRLDLRSTVSDIREFVTSVAIPSSVGIVEPSCFQGYVKLQSAIWETDQEVASIGIMHFLRAAIS